MQIYNCLTCGIECKAGRTKVNKFCSVVCQHKYAWTEIIRPEIEAGVRTQPGVLKKYLSEERGALCEKCGNGETWNGLPLTLQLDHIDGDSDNNFPSNLRLLCPNCHTQTETFGNGGLGNRYRKGTKRNKYLQEYKLGA